MWIPVTTITQSLGFQSLTKKQLDALGLCTRLDIRSNLHVASSKNLSDYYAKYEWKRNILFGALDKLLAQLAHECIDIIVVKREFWNNYKVFWEMVCSTPLEQFAVEWGITVKPYHGGFQLYNASHHLAVATLQDLDPYLTTCQSQLSIQSFDAISQHILQVKPKANKHF